jgi:predicted transcriptional regulator
MPRKTLHTPQQIEGLIKVYGSAYQAARALHITPQAFYEQMHRRGIKPEGYQPLNGEPDGRMKKKNWLREIITRHQGNLCAVARELGISRSAVVSRMETYRIKNTNPNLDKRKREFTKIFKSQNGKVGAIAKVLGVTPSAVYERVRRYELVS